MLLTGDDEEQPSQLTYAELLRGITRAANYFHDLAGPTPGVGIMLPHLFETHFALWGAETAGYAVPINYLLQPDHLVHLLKASGAKILVALGPHPELDVWQKAVEVARRLPGLRLVQVAITDAELPADVESFSKASAAYEESSLSFGRARRGDDVAAYFHTGGTTGRPKLVAHTHRNQLVAAFGGATLLEFSETDVMTHGLPLFHVAGTIICGISAFMAAVSLVVLSPIGLRNPVMIQKFWKIISRYRVTISGGIPTVMAALLNVPVENSDLSSIRLSMSGAAAAPRSLVEQYEAKTGFKVHEILGMTECGGLLSVTPSAAERVTGSVGFRLPYTQTAVRQLRNDGSLGDRCQPYEVGVLTVSGPTVTPGYRDGEDSQNLLDDGVLNSGDLAYTDDDGRIYIVGRSKDVIIRSGHNIDPQMIEDALQRHPMVALAAAVGQPDKYAGELPVCYVVPKPGAAVELEGLFEFAKQHIGERPAWPKHIYLVDTIPVTAVGKIFKPDLRMDALRRLVMQVISGASVQGTFEVSIATGGMHGPRVNVSLSGASPKDVQYISDLLEGYHFEHSVVAVEPTS